MKKPLVFLSGMLIGTIICLVIFLIINIQIANKSSIKIINDMWSIKLSNPYKEIYSLVEDENFIGNGYKYGIYEYKNEEDISLFLKFKEGKNKFMELEVDEILKSLHVSKLYMPEFKYKYKYYLKTKNDLSTIYLIFISSIKRLYIIQDIE